MAKNLTQQAIKNELNSQGGFNGASCASAAGRFFLDKALPRHKTHGVKVGDILIGAGAPIAVQSMTNTDSADIKATAQQIEELYFAGSELVRITIDREEAARAVPFICEELAKRSINVPIIGDFHYNGHRLLKQFPACAELLAKYRINPGNVGFKDKRDKQFSEIIDIALYHDKPVRIGVNWGSLDQELLAQIRGENGQNGVFLSEAEITNETVIRSALLSAARARELGMAEDKIILSAKVSQLQPLIYIYCSLARRSQYALHLGLTEAGMGARGLIASAAALAILLEQGIGDTLRISLTPQPGGARCEEVRAAQELLQALGFRRFMPSVTACPGCGRTASQYFQNLARSIEKYLAQKMPLWRKTYPGCENLHIAVMGCIVNGPGESKFADIGISLPGIGENPSAPVFIEGKKTATIHGGDVAGQFQAIIENYVKERYGQAKA